MSETTVTKSPRKNFISFIFSWVLSPIFWIVFVVAFFIFHPIFVICLRLGRSIYKKAVDLGNLSLLLSLKIMGTRFQVQGLTALSRNQSLIFVSNHQSLFDIPLCIWSLRAFHPRFIAKQELGRGLPAVSHALRNMGSALIDRGNSQQALTSIEHFGKHCVQEGASAIIFPEGTRARNGVMKKFKTAGLIVLLRAMPDCQVVPIAIQRSWELLRWNMFPVPFGVQVTLNALTPIERGTLSEEEIALLVEKRIREFAFSRSS